MFNLTSSAIYQSPFFWCELQALEICAVEMSAFSIMAYGGQKLQNNTLKKNSKATTFLTKLHLASISLPPRERATHNKVSGLFDWVLFCLGYL